MGLRLGSAIRFRDRARDWYKVRYEIKVKDKVGNKDIELGIRNRDKIRDRAMVSLRDRVGNRDRLGLGIRH